MSITKDFSFLSGERQTGIKVEDIRKDHLVRYEFVVEYLKNKFKNKKIIGADIFCGVGYGAKLITDGYQNSELDAFDGSEETIANAEQYYQNGKINFSACVFPFKLKPNYYDFMVSIESVEHVEDDELYLKEIVSSLKPGGILFISTPNDEKYSLTKHKIKYHHRHYIPEDFEMILKSHNLEILAIYGHDSYIMNDEMFSTGKLVDDCELKLNYEGQNILFVCRKKGTYSLVKKRILNKKYVYTETITTPQSDIVRYFNGVFEKRLEKNVYRYFLFGKEICQKYDYYSILQNQNKKLDEIEKKYYNLQVLSQVPLKHKFFEDYRNSLNGRDVVIMGTGPSFKSFKPFKNAVYIGVNGVTKIFDKLDYLFVQDQFMLDTELNSVVDNYKGNSCKKFFGLLPQNRLKGMNNNSLKNYRKIDNLRVAQERLNAPNVYSYLLEDLIENKWATDLTTEALGDFRGTIFSALQFALFCNPKRIFIVGCDASTGVCYDCKFNFSHEHQIKNWKSFKLFAKRNYPSTEIISINPVGLKNIFKDIYTETGVYTDKMGNIFDIELEE